MMQHIYDSALGSDQMNFSSTLCVALCAQLQTNVVNDIDRDQLAHSCSIILEKIRYEFVGKNVYKEMNENRAGKGGQETIHSSKDFTDKHY